MRKGNGKKLESDKVSYLAVVLLLRVKDPVTLICHCRAVLSAQLGQKCRMCQPMRQHDCKHCILCETWIFQIILTNLLDLSLSRMGVRQLAAPRSSLLVLSSMLRQAMTCCSFSICRAKNSRIFWLTLFC